MSVATSSVLMEPYDLTTLPCHPAAIDDTGGGAAHMDVMVTVTVT